jgi:hypothetical protein
MRRVQWADCATTSDLDGISLLSALHSLGHVKAHVPTQARGVQSDSAKVRFDCSRAKSLTWMWSYRSAKCSELKAMAELFRPVPLQSVLSRDQTFMCRCHKSRCAKELLGSIQHEDQGDMHDK